MFFLEKYKFFRSKEWVFVGLSILLPLFIVFLGDSEDDLRFIYNPLLQNESMSWIYFARNYNLFFILFFSFFLIVFYALVIYLDKEANLLDSFSVSQVSKIKFWIIKYLFLQLVTLVYIMVYLTLPVLLYMISKDYSAIGIEFLQTTVFLSIKSWISLLYTTTVAFLLYLSISKLYLGILLTLGIYIWILILPGSPIALFAKSVNSFGDLSQDRLPFLWNLESFKWELISIKMTLIVILLFIITALILRRTVQFQRLLFGFLLISFMNISCNYDNKRSGKANNLSMAARDSLLVQWLDTAQVTDTEGQHFVLSDLLQSTSAKVLYLDFWNSYCVPCMKAFPELNELSRQYPMEELKIIYVNADEESERWAKALSFTGNLSLTDHYRILSPDFKVLSKVGLNIYPRYMVMNRKREILELRAPLPDKEYIDSLLVVE